MTSVRQRRPDPGGPASCIAAAVLGRVAAATGRPRASRPVIVKQLAALRSPAALARALAYVARTELGGAPVVVDEAGRRLDGDEAVDQAAAWTALRPVLHNSDAALGRHFVFTMPVDDEAGGADRALEALEAAAAATFGAWGQRYVAARHLDTAHPHMHVVVDWHRPAGPLLPLDPSGLGLDALRTAVAEAGRAAGFDVDGCRAADVVSPAGMIGRRRLEDGEFADELIRRQWARNRGALAAALLTWFHEPWAAVLAQHLVAEAKATAPAQPARAASSDGERGSAAAVRSTPYPEVIGRERTLRDPVPRGATR